MSAGNILKEQPFVVDSHCHLASLSYSGKAGTTLEEILCRARHCAVTHYLSIACELSEFDRLRDLTCNHPEIYLSCGVHPLNIKAGERPPADELKARLSHPRVVALGEIGLDYHYAADTREIQLEYFAAQLELAQELKLPVVIHAREAAADTLKLLRSDCARNVRGVLHCFTDSVEMAGACLDLGFYISFTGIATFGKSDNVREALKYVPLDRLMVETDSPYLAPVPVRGVENEPAFTRYVLDYVAAFKEISSSQLAELSSRNFETLYGVKLTKTNPPEVPCSRYKLEPIFDVPLGMQVKACPGLR